MAILKAIDENWVEQVDYLQQLRAALSGHASQKNPLVEFFQEAYLPTLNEWKWAKEQWSAPKQYEHKKGK